jgi:5-methylcytosine-specific restriction endonuclease McrA
MKRRTDGLRTCRKCNTDKPEDSKHFKWQNRAKGYFSSYCRECVNKEQREKHAENPEYMREAQRRSREKHREKRNAEWRVYYEENKETLKELRKQRYHDDPEREQEWNRAWRERNIERLKEYEREYRRDNPEVKRRSEAKRRAQKRGAGFSETVDIEVLIERDEGVCHLCYRPCARIDASIDHIVPLNKGGDHSYVNTALAHHRCNSRKRDKEIPSGAYADEH